MFFLISKLFHFLILPSTWLLILLVLAIFTKKSIRRKRYLWSTLLIYFLFGNGFIVDEFSRAWEVDATTINADKTYEYGVVLSGMTVYDPEFNRVNFHGNVDRLLQALPLLQNGQIKTLIISGGDGTAFQKEVKEADALKAYLNKIEFTTDNIVLESASRNTNENAKFTKALLDSLGAKPTEILLITSANHMRRSLKCFSKQGLNCVPYVTNRTAGHRKFDLDHVLLPQACFLAQWRALIHEIVGYASYKIMGYI